MEIWVVSRIMTEGAFVVVLAFVAGPFWSCLKSPSHLRKMLADQNELRRFIDRSGYGAPRALETAPLLTSYGRSIELRNKAHLQSLSYARNYLGTVCLAVLALSIWTGYGYFAVSAGVFLLGLSQAPQHAEVTNAKHLSVLISNVLKWSRVDDAACARFCTEQHPEYSALYLLLAPVRAISTVDPM